MKYSVERFDARQWSDDQIAELFSERFPPFITADPIAHAHIKRVGKYFGDEHHIMLVDTEDRPAACGWGVPVQWTGEMVDLPSGYTDTLGRAVKDHETQTSSNTFVICAGVVNPKLARKGVAGQLILAFKELASQFNLSQVIAPVRPTSKHQYPLTPIETYAGWVRPDGLPFDPWLRSHIKVGGKIVSTAPHSQTMTGTVEQWEQWTEMKFLSTGHYVIPDGLSTLYIDRERDVGTYTEPNVWVLHR